MPTHAHNKAPTADRLVAGGGFFGQTTRVAVIPRGRTHHIYMECRSLSAPLRPSAPGGRGLRRRPSVRRPPFVAPPRQVRAPFGQVHAKSPRFFAFPLHFSEKNPPFQKTLLRFARSLRRRAHPHGRGAGEKFHIAAENVRRNAHAFTFFLFLLAFYAGKTRYICIENLFYQLRMAKSRRFVPVFVCPPECSPPFLPSL